ncbi:DsbA family protein [Marinicauda algicola]|uniref:DsbA family protein n=1 Tax=Marinicauda algicola TaxID=2029849 RepID=A0A4S2GWK1_9PROT|nr:DsbA family protein [Marinicauda algicola]TGY87211.1 DsbA family protein [Marinicauda algicola]
MTLTRRLFSGAAIAASLLLAACGGGGAPAGQSQYEREGDHAKGPADAPVVFIEYASVACPACAAFHQQAMGTINEYVETGDVRFVFREMITGQPRLAVAGFMLARCAPQERYFDVLDILFEQQRALFSAMQAGTAQQQLVTIARSVGLSEQEFFACMNDETLLQAVQAANQEAADAGIDATPTFIVNGERLEAQRGPEGNTQVWYAGATMLEDEQGPIPYNFEGDTFERIILYFKARAGQ